MKRYIIPTLTLIGFIFYIALATIDYHARYDTAKTTFMEESTYETRTR